MGYYDEGFLQLLLLHGHRQFAVSDGVFSPVGHKSIDNRIATFTGGTNAGPGSDPGGDDKLSQLAIKTIFMSFSAAMSAGRFTYNGGRKASARPKMSARGNPHTPSSQRRTLAA